MSHRKESDAAPDPTASDPREADKAAQSPASSDLGQEGTKSNIKPNTSGGGRREDRGP